MDYGLCTFGWKIFHLVDLGNEVVVGCLWFEMIDLKHSWVWDYVDTECLILVLREFPDACCFAL